MHILCDWRAVGPRPEGLGLMAFSMVPGGINPREVEFFSLPLLALHAVFVPVVEYNAHDIRKKKKRKRLGVRPTSRLLHSRPYILFTVYLCTPPLCFRDTF